MMAQKEDPKTLIKSNVGNYYGSVQVCKLDGKPHICVENWDGWHWQSCSEEFYQAFKKEFKRKK